MTPLNHYLQDGANRQARAVLCMLQGQAIEESWNEQFSTYDAEPKVSRWENCREQGYVAMLWHRKTHKRLCIAWFEHRNSDSICALRWEQNGINSPTIDTADFGGACYRDKFDVSHQVGFGEILKMAEWIQEQLCDWWIANDAAKAKDTAT